MESLLRKRRRILLLFLLGVGAPSLALGYLALRGIRNELAMQQQRRLGEYRAVAQLVGDSVLHHLADSERRAASLTGDAGAPAATARVRSPGPGEMPARLVEQVFRLDERGAVQFPARSLNYYPDGSLPPAAVRPWPPAAASAIQTARYHEFQQQQYDTALAEYRRAFGVTSDPAQRAEALVAIIRIERRTGRLRSAISSCDRLAEEYGAVRTAQGQPVGAVARLEQAGLLLAVGDSAAALQTYFDLIQSLVGGDWSLEQAQYDFYAGQATNAIDRLLAPAPGPDSMGRWREVRDSLLAREAAGRARTERLLRFRELAGQEISARLNATSGPGPVRFALESAGQTYLVSLSPDSSEADTRAHGVLFKENTLAIGVQRLLTANLDSARASWMVRGRDGRVVTQHGRADMGALGLTVPIADGFPPWLIELHERPLSTYRRLFATSQSGYFYMFLLIATILAFGLVLAIRAVSHELELARLKSDFVSTVSHEFRSPLTSIHLLAEMLQAGTVPSEEKRQRYYDVLVEQSSRLSALVNNILDLARLEAGKKELVLEALDLGDLVRELAASTQARVEHAGYQLAVAIAEALPPVRVDRAAISQAILNLIDNAMQYSPDSKLVELSVAAEGSQVMIAVTDHGAGIPADEIDKVFERFYRGGDPLTRGASGSGLGLALVREIVLAHGGTVQARSKPGQGSTFFIRLPAAQERDHVEDSDHRG